MVILNAYRVELVDKEGLVLFDGMDGVSFLS